MKRFTGTTLSLCLCIAAATSFAQNFETDPDVVFLDVSLYSESDDFLNMYGPFLWAAQSWVIGTPPPLSNMRLDVTLSDSDGNPLYVGSVSGVDLSAPPPPPPPPGPFPPPPPPPPVPVSLVVIPEGLMVISQQGSYLVALEPVPPPVVEVAVDIKPHSDRNPFNMRSRGVLPVAILGASDFDVRTLDVRSLTVAGVAPRFAVFADVAGGEDSRSCGYGDTYLYLFIRSSQLADVLGDVQHGSVVDLEILGETVDATSVIGFDSVTIINKERKRKGPNVRKRGKR